MANCLKNTLTGEIEEVHDKDILKIESEKNGKGVIFYTASATYKLPTSLEDWEIIKFKQGFRLTDRSNLVNVSQVSSIGEFGNIHFYDTDEVTASIAHIHLDYVKTLINGLKIGKRAEEIELEYVSDHSPKVKSKVSSFFRKYLIPNVSDVQNTIDNN